MLPKRIILLCVMWTMAAFAAAQSYSVTVLAGLTGSSSTIQVKALNNYGESAGISTASDGRQKPVKWSSSGVATDLGLLSTWTWAYGEAKDINDAGDVVGYSTTQTVGEQPHAFYWHNGTLNDIHPSGWVYSFAFSINSAGLVLGSGTETGYGAKHFVYDPATGNYTYFTDPNDSVSQDGGLNTNGDFVTRVGLGRVTHYQTGSYFTMPTPVSGWTMVPARITEQGQVCGSFRNTSTGEERAFIFTPSGVNGTSGWTRDLGQYSGGVLSMAKGINAFGHTVGKAWPSSGGPIGFLYEGSGYINLNTLVPSGTSNIIEAADINDHRQVVCNVSGGVPPVLLTRLP